MIKFIHAADIHLDSPLRGLAQYDGAPFEMLRSATRRAFENLVQAALDENVAFVVIAGDIYDGDWRDFNTGLFFIRQLGRLIEAGIRVVLLYGNHDAESQLTKSLPIAGPHVFPSRAAGTVHFDDLGVALHGRSFKDRAITENLLPTYPHPVSGMLNIGVLHTALEGNSQHPTYAPCSLVELANKGYQYWALGHVHAAQICSLIPWVVFPGNLQGRHAKETGPKGAILTTIEDQAIASVEPIHVDVLRWIHVTVDAEGATTRGVVEDRVRENLVAALRDDADGRPIAARVTIRGACSAHADLIANDDLFRADLRAIGAGMGSNLAWIEKIRLETAPEERRAGTACGEHVSDQLRQILGDAPDDLSLCERLQGELSDLLAKLPSDARADLDIDGGPLKWVEDGRIDEVVRDAMPLLLARLNGREG